ncbi:MAG: S8 family serine peptidase, partial [Candidatus Sericytochromatia bacterium]|nr:S8 family serine peptidase [Candidatus Tanganyikabacteria bacterium]
MTTLRRVRKAGLAAGLSVLAALTGCGAAKNPYSIATQKLQQAARSSAPAASSLLVKLKSSASADGVAQSVGARTVSSFPQLGMVVLGLPGGTTASRAMASLAGNPGVAFAEPNFRMRSRPVPRGTGPTTYRTQIVSSDPGVAQQWGHKAIDVFGAWDYTLGDPRVVVAVVDTGVDLHHTDLKRQLVAGRTFVSGTSSPMDDNGHGTHVAGIIGAEMNNSLGIAGVAPKCKLMPVKVLDAKGEGNTSDIVAGLLYAADSGARIINLSLGGGSGSKALEEAIKYAHGKGSLVVAAMGNDGKNVQEFPAAYAGVISVGATGRDNVQADFSNYGQ